MEEIINKVFSKQIGAINTRERKSLETFLICCLNIDYLYSPEIFDKATNREKSLIIMIDDVLVKTSLEALGYWTAKLEEMKRNKKSVKKRTDTKEDYKAKLKEMLKTMSKKECRIEAQAKFKVTDRTILNYLKEIKEEKTAILRKNKDIA